MRILCDTYEMKNSEIYLGIDVGGVIIDDSDGIFRGPDFLNAKPMDGAFEAIETIVDELSPEQVCIISKVRSDTKIRWWLDKKDFYSRTGIAEQNVRFCRYRHEKAGIAQDILAQPLTHFVDNRAEVLGHMVETPERYLFGPQPELHQQPVPIDEFTLTATWQAVLEALGMPTEKLLQGSR